MRRFVVTGTGRSGTAYTSAVLRAAGINCPHEGVFLPREPDLRRLEEVDGDASWYAAPFLDRLPPGTVVFHQVREPLAVIGSWAERDAFRRVHVEGNVLKHLGKRLLRAAPSGTYATYRFVARWCPQVFRERGEVARAARYWVDWNLMVEANAERAGLTYRRHRLSDLPDAVTGIVEAIGGPSPDRAAHGVPPNVNAGRSSRRVAWDDLPERLGAEVHALAERYQLVDR